MSAVNLKDIDLFVGQGLKKLAIFLAGGKITKLFAEVKLYPLTT
jgi:hypothetical protein